MKYFTDYISTYFIQYFIRKITDSKVKLSIENITIYPTNIYLFKFNNSNTRKGCEINTANYEDTRTTSLTSFWCLYC